MGGRAILFLVMGFSILFLVVGQNFGRLTSTSVKNSTDYYNHYVSHNIAVSGANLALNQIYFMQTWEDGYSNVSISGGTMSVVVVDDPNSKSVSLTAIGIYNKDTSRIAIKLTLINFGKYAYCSNDENGIWWANQDVINGPFHTQDYLNVYGQPTFNPGASYVGTFLGIKKYNSSSSPIINGTFKNHDSLVIPSTGVSDLEAKATAGGYVFTGHDTVYLTLALDSLRYRFSYNGAWTTKKDSEFAPNKTIVAHNAILKVQGILQGQLTIGASGSSRGSVYLDDDVVYKTDPSSDPSSTDLLGIVAQNNVLVTYSTANTDIKINAAIFAQNGGFGADNYQNRPPSGFIHLLGGITQNGRQAVGSLDKYGNVSHGFSKIYTYDNRLAVNVPPNFPATNAYQVFSWYE